MNNQITARELRQQFFDFFNSRGHVYVHSSSTIPHNDPSLLFANAGMNQYKPIFQGTADPNSELGQLKRAYNSQKCIRAGGKHNDLDDVGRDVYHHTFFEMLGNWSFGDYFKKEACGLAWELLTDVWKIPRERLYVTYFGGDSSCGLPADEEARDVWISIGEEGGSLRPLPAKHIDTGMGFERVLSVLQDKRSNYDTDLFTPLFKAIEAGTNTRPYTGKVGIEDTDKIDMAYRVLADHARVLTIALGDGGRAQNTGRGYVIRRILRRAVRYAVEVLNAKPGFLSTLVDVVIEILGDAFPEITRDPVTIKELINEEEEQFLVTLRRGQRLLSRVIKDLKASGTNNTLSGEVAWRLYDTYGFPLDLTQILAEEHHLKIDLKGYEKAKEEAQMRSQGGKCAGCAILDLDVHALGDLKNKSIPTTDDSEKFIYTSDANGNYVFPDSEATVLAIRYENNFIENIDLNGELCGIILNKTIFYAESGGQLYDHGFITSCTDEITEFSIVDVRCRGGYILHIGSLQGRLIVGSKVRLSLDAVRRTALMRNHTGTHVLNYALRELVDESDQKGSLVAPDRLRFDFTAKRGMNRNELAKAEEICDAMISKHLKVYSADVSLSYAKTIQGARAVFGEAYPDPVRVVSIGVPVTSLVANPEKEYGKTTSVEFCGGTHVHNTKHIGVLVIVSEEAIAKGIRRIVALTGHEAERAQKEALRLDNEVSELIKSVNKLTNSHSQNVNITDYFSVNKQMTNLSELVSRSVISQHHRENLREKLNEVRKLLDARDKASKTAIASKVLEEARLLGETLADSPNHYTVHVFNAQSNTKIINSAIKELERLCPNKAVMAFSSDPVSQKLTCLCQVPKELVSRGLKANEWVTHISKTMNGKGGGKDTSAQAVGNRLEALDEVIRLADVFASTKLKDC
ncbi:Alanine--tRNA ligase, cytoplasmic [Schistosoma japonicum]|nr:Alanine--tRNA ligase, cytoplasmic [Schistosoma japonicum]